MPKKSRVNRFNGRSRGGVPTVVVVITVLIFIAVAIYVAYWYWDVARKMAERPLLKPQGRVTIAGGTAYLTLNNDGKRDFNGEVCLITPWGRACKSGVSIPVGEGASIEIPLGSISIPANTYGFECEIRATGVEQIPATCEVLRG